MTDAELLPCPFCGVPLTVRSPSVNPNGRCDTEGCWMRERSYSVVIDDPKQLAQWNTRAPSSLGSMSAEVVERLFAATAHGDQEHRDWLHDAYTAFFAGEPVPEPRGKGNKEKRIAELDAALAQAPRPMAPKCGGKSNE